MKQAIKVIIRTDFNDIGTFDLSIETEFGGPDEISKAVDKFVAANLINISEFHWEYA